MAFLTKNTFKDGGWALLIIIVLIAVVVGDSKSDNRKFWVGVRIVIASLIVAGVMHYASG